MNSLKRICRKVIAFCDIRARVCVYKTNIYILFSRRRAHLSQIAMAEETRHQITSHLISLIDNGLLTITDEQQASMHDAIRCGTDAAIDSLRR